MNDDRHGEEADHLAGELGEQFCKEVEEQMERVREQLEMEDGDA